MKNYLSILRISHWSKNIFVFVALIFGGTLAGPVRDVLAAIGITLAGFFCFSLAASAVYIFNDIIDRKTDILHPEKRNRAIASGAITVGQAAVISVGCAAAAIVWSYAIVRELAIVIAIYIGLMVLYSLLLKRMMILDCVGNINWLLPAGGCGRCYSRSVYLALAAYLHFCFVPVSRIWQAAQ
jgi:4-hydroxybenzoate polyprenyltransferase